MSTYFGKLAVHNGQSNLDMALLLLEGFPDPTQAMFRATQFLLNDRNLQPGQDIWVTGNGGAIGTISAIIIDDAGAIPAEGPNLSDAFTRVAADTDAASKKRSAKRSKEVDHE